MSKKIKEHEEKFIHISKKVFHGTLITLLLAVTLWPYLAHVPFNPALTIWDAFKLFGGVIIAAAPIIFFSIVVTDDE